MLSLPKCSPWSFRDSRERTALSTICVGVCATKHMELWVCAWAESSSESCRASPYLWWAHLSHRGSGVPSRHTQSNRESPFPDSFFWPPARNPKLQSEPVRKDGADSMTVQRTPQKMSVIEQQLLFFLVSAQPHVGEIGQLPLHRSGYLRSLFHSIQLPAFLVYQCGIKTVFLSMHNG